MVSGVPVEKCPLRSQIGISVVSGVPVEGSRGCEMVFEVVKMAETVSADISDPVARRKIA